VFEIPIPAPCYWWQHSQPHGVVAGSAIDYDSARLTKKSLPRIATNKENIHKPGRPSRVDEIACHLFPSLWKASQSWSSSSFVHGSRPGNGSRSAADRVPETQRILTDGGIHSVLVPFGTLVVCPTREVFRNLIPTFSVFVNGLHESCILTGGPSTLNQT
jgi:hypothetical protein